MKVTEHWLREWVDPPLDIRQLAEQLTMAGLEVETVEKCVPDFSGVVVARVKSITAHPDSEKLHVCVIEDGGGKVTVVSAAGNLKAGMQVPFARAGAQLHGGKKISSATIKGVASAGMLCSAQDLGLAESAECVLELPQDTRPGSDIASLLPADDNIMDIAITPNRGDCLSIAGIARELAVLNHCHLRPPEIPVIPAVNKAQRSVRLDAPEACPHYVGRRIEAVDVSRPAPLWMTTRLHRCGIRSINAIVDITNYVMLELGQPMHAFADEYLQGTIHVRHASDGELLVLLDGKECPLDKNVLVIADDQQVLALAGVMGGLHSAVTTGSRAIFLESAWFTPQAIIGHARRLGLHTDSFYRFERGVDFTLQRKAVERATRLICDICGGKPGPIIEETTPAYLPVTRQIRLHDMDIKRLLGLTIKPDEVTRILRALGMQVVDGARGWLAVPPPWRSDISITADLCEEIARVHGYGRIPEHAPQISMQFHTVENFSSRVERISTVLVNRGYQEAITYSFVDNKLQDLINPDVACLKLTNPISADLAVMRTSLWPGLLQVLQYNIKRQQERIRLFEAGLVFSSLEGDILQTPMLGGVTYGNPYEIQWDKKDIACDYFDIKGDVEAILQSGGMELEDIHFKTTRHHALHPGLSAEIFFENQAIGWVGALHPALQLALDIPKQAYLFELHVNSISRQLPTRYKKISKYPVVKRDLAVVVSVDISVEKVMHCIKDTVPDMLINLELFDVYQGEGIDLGKKSLALGLTFQRSSSTLIDEEVEVGMGKILSRLQNELGGTLRE
jgi:phenylalanyl-tRNA synthetase beta chain